MKIVKDDSPIIYKQDIIDDDGKLNLVGVFLIISLVVCTLNLVSKYLKDNIVDKDKICYV